MTASGPAAAPELSVASLTPGQQLPDREEYVSFAQICQVTAVTGDWYPGHYDPVFARSQGQPTIFMSTLYFHGLIDKYVTGLLGPDTLIYRRRMRMKSSVYAESRLAVRGSVLSVDAGARRATIMVALECGDQVPVTAEVTAGTQP
jgi:acyl dehydratase